MSHAISFIKTFTKLLVALTGLIIALRGLILVITLVIE